VPGEVLSFSLIFILGILQILLIYVNLNFYIVSEFLNSNNLANNF
jgi:hypothetical protein